MSCPPPIDRETLLQYLTDARAAYHNLMTGTAVVEVRDQNGESVRFSSANRANLYAYIQELDRLLCVSPTKARPNRPMGFVF